MRATGRGRELAIRTTLGAGQWRLVRQMLTEGLVLSLLGGIGGLAARLRRRPRADRARRRRRSRARRMPPCTCRSSASRWLLAVVTGLIFGLVPAIAAIRGNAALMLKEDATRGSAGRSTGFMRAALVVGETAVALMLLIGAGLLIKSFARLQQVDPGFERAERADRADWRCRPRATPTPADRAQFWTRLVEKAQQIPGVTSVGTDDATCRSTATSAPARTRSSATRRRREKRAPHARQEIVGADYFQAMKIPLIEGRLLHRRPTRSRRQPVAIVDQLHGREATSRAAAPSVRRSSAAVPTSPRIRIVGVVGTINSIDLGMPVTKERIYRPMHAAGAGRRWRWC